MNSIRRGVVGVQAAKSSFLLAVAGALAGIAAPAGAQGPALPLTGELQANQFTNGDQAVPSVGMGDNGVHVVIWTSFGQDGDESGIVLRRFPADGTQPFNESVVNQQTANDQDSPGLGMNANGDWIATWDTTTAGQGLRGRASSLNGTSIGNEFAVSVATDAAPQFPGAARADDDSSIAVWSIPGAVLFRRFDASSAPITGDSDGTPQSESGARPAVGLRPAGGAWLAYAASDADEVGVFVQSFDAAGDADGAVFAVAASPANPQTQASLDTAADGGFVIAWRDLLLGVRVRCFGADGSPRSAEIAVDPIGPFKLDVGVAPDGQFVVVFHDELIWAREFDRTCRPVGDAFQVNETVEGFQRSPDAAAGRDRFVVVWHTQNLDDDGAAVARRLYRFRTIFADGFEEENLVAWSSTAP